VDLTSDVNALVTFVTDAASTGGGDSPEVIRGDFVSFFLTALSLLKGPRPAERNGRAVGPGGP
jgi:hypothetical protein